MKKLVLFVAVVTAISFASCSNKTKEATPEAEAPVIEQQAPVVEEPANDSISTNAATEAPAGTPAAE